MRGAADGCRCASRSRSGCCRARPSCCPSPPRRTPRSSRGSAVAAMPSSTASCASPSRSRCTPARGWRWRSTCAASCSAPRPSARRAPDRRDRALAARRPRSPAGLLRALRSSAASADRDRSRPACSPGRSRWGSPTPARRRPGAAQDDAGPLDGLALGLAQAVALAPGVSRSGATLTAARAARLSRRDAQALSWHAALPVILGATALKGLRLRALARAPGALAGAPLAAGAASALASTLAAAESCAPSAHAIGRCCLRPLPLLLAALVLARMRAGRAASAAAS